MKYRFYLLRLFLFAVIAFGANTAKGQSIIGFAPNGFSGWPDSVQAGQTIPVAALLKNYDTATVFQDSFRVDGYVDTGAAYLNFSIPFYQLYQMGFTVNPLDSELIILPIDFDLGSMGGNFHVGNNVVVVWPISENGVFTTLDSITLNVIVIDTLSSIHEDPESEDVRIYPVPANGPVFITSYHPLYQVESVIIYDVNGQVMYKSEPNSTGPIDTERWAPGMYLVETTLSNGAVSYYKILRQ